jgi:hypothetical protein
LIGNLIALAEATTGATLSGAVLTSGAGSISTAISEIRAQCQVNSEVLEALDRIDASASAEV